MFNIFHWYADYQLKRLEVKERIANAPYAMITDLVKQQTDASREQSKILQEWLAGFQTTTLPSSTIIRDSDEYHQEQERLVQELQKHGELDLAAMVAKNLENL